MPQSLCARSMPEEPRPPALPKGCSFCSYQPFSLRYSDLDGAELSPKSTHGAQYYKGFKDPAWCQEELSLTAGQNAKQCSHLGRQSGSFYKTTHTFAI